VAQLPLIVRLYAGNIDLGRTRKGDIPSKNAFFGQNTPKTVNPDCHIVLRRNAAGRHDLTDSGQKTQNAARMNRRRFLILNDPEG